jgi:lipopolysaccharide transport system permease protein
MTSSEASVSVVQAIAKTGRAAVSETGPAGVDSVHERYFGHEHVCIIEPIKGWRALDIKELWAYRELLLVLTMRDIKVRYKQTILGFTWAIIQPIMMMVVFSIFFGRLAKMPSGGLPYPIFVYAGLLPWLFFANAVSGSANSLVGSAHLVSKVYFPRLVIPLASIGSGIVDFAIAWIVLLVLMLFYDVGWSAHLLLAPLLIVGVIFIALGVGTFLCALNVAYRDFRYVIPYMVQLWLFVTPVVYPASLVPEAWRWALYLNPMAGFVEAFRAAFLNQPFDFGGLALSFGVAVIVFFAGVAYFEKVERQFADII